MVISPLNYAGNKAKLLKEIIPLFPQNIDIFVDAFSGSGIVAFNSNASKVICNDINKYAIELIKYLYENSADFILDSMNEIIAEFGFTDSTNPQNKYIEIKHEGLSKYNKEAFNKLKTEYNNNKSVNLLFALVIYSFNHYLRFNGTDKYNVPVGKVDFSSSLRKKTIDFTNEMKKYDASFYVGSFIEPVLYENCTKDSLVYFDPPYSITTAPYNISWTDKDDFLLFSKFDELSKLGVKVAISNVFLSNSKENKNLIAWSKKYNVHFLNRQYRNANYQKKNITDSIEVLITNY